MDLSLKCCIESSDEILFIGECTVPPCRCRRNAAVHDAAARYRR